MTGFGVRRLIIVSLVALLCFFTEESEADTTAQVPQPIKTTATKAYDDTKKLLTEHVKNPFYFGGSLGYGNTNWSEITTPAATKSNHYNQVALSAPISATSGVFASGAFMGYQFSPHFMIETDYTHFDTTEVGFQTTVDYPPPTGQKPWNNFYGISQLNTNTNAYSLLGKILVPFGFTQVYVYADAGVTYVQRDDLSYVAEPSVADPSFKLMDIGHFGPSFGFGLAYNITQHIFSEAAFQYTTGYGKANLEPAEYYIPFIYTLMFNLGIRV